MNIKLSAREIDAIISCIGYVLDHAAEQGYSYPYLLTLYGKLIDIQDACMN